MDNYSKDKNSNNKFNVVISLFFICVFTILNLLIPILKVINFGIINFELRGSFLDLLSNPVYQALLGDLENPLVSPIFFNFSYENSTSVSDDVLWTLFETWSVFFVLFTILGLILLLIKPIIQMKGIKVKNDFYFSFFGFLLALNATAVEYGLIYLAMLTGNKTDPNYAVQYSINYFIFILFVFGTVALILGFLFQIDWFQKKIFTKLGKLEPDN